MTLPAGLASIASTWDDTPQVRGAVAFCKAAATSRKSSAYTDIAAGLNDAIGMVEAGSVSAAIDNHAWLAIRGAYRSRDTRNGTR